MVSPIPEVFVDAKANQCGKEHCTPMEHLFKKLICQEFDGVADGPNMDEMMDVFWSEYDEFLSKSGVFGGHDYIWNASVLQVGESYKWHKKYSLPFTKYFGKFACQVTSKILGIGSAERNWGEVKHLKTDKQSHLLAEHTKKQATIFGSDCAERAQIKRDAATRHEPESTTVDTFFWDDDDFDSELDFNSASYEKEQKKKSKSKHVVKCWMEDWEVEAVAKKDPVAEAKLLQKYGGLEFYDIDNNLGCLICDDELVWLG